MLNKSLYIAATCISLAFTLPAQARDNDHENQDRYNTRTIIVEKNIQYKQYNDRYDEHDDDRYEHHHKYREHSRHHDDDRDERRYSYEDHHEHYVYYPELHLLNHIIVALANR
jgi:hypothetical protein